MNTKPQSPQQTLLEQITYQPHHLNIPVLTSWEGESDDSMGMSELTVLVAALKAYEEHIEKRWTEGVDKTKTLNVLNSLLDSTLHEAFYRLGQSEAIVRQLKRTLPR